MFWIWTTWTTAISLESKTASCQRMDNRNPANLRCYRGGRQWAGIFRPFVFVCRPGECPKGSRHRPFTTTAVRTPIAVISRQGERGDNQNPFHLHEGSIFQQSTQCVTISGTKFGGTLVKSDEIRKAARNVPRRNENYWEEGGGLGRERET
ncbi:uncharacterized protein LOC143143720 isoform X3 [Ptiloglossa arizonensis]|uniref:uncharacterized protein LOC143143720 isoform X3 n=1 Tax=Ptiloglossa arizonensis TaxID=3350558 RepID=UPI003F9ECBEC